jgi:hypothetical protein
LSLPAYSMEDNLWEANRRSGGKKFSRILWDTNVHFRNDGSLPAHFILEQINAVGYIPNNVSASDTF